MDDQPNLCPGSAGLAVAGERGGAQRSGRDAKGRQDQQHPVPQGEQGQGEVLDADVVVVQRLRLAQREFQALLRAWRERDMTARSRAGQKLGLAAGARGQGGVARRDGDAGGGSARPAGLSPRPVVCSGRPGGLW